MRGRKRSALGSLLTATALLMGASGAMAQGPPAGPGDDAAAQPKTTQATVDRAKDLAQQACATAAASAAARDADPTNVDKTAKAAADAAECAARTESAGKEQTSLAGVNGGVSAAPAPNATTSPTNSWPGMTGV